MENLLVFSERLVDIDRRLTDEGADLLSHSESTLGIDEDGRRERHGKSRYQSLIETSHKEAGYEALTNAKFMNALGAEAENEEGKEGGEEEAEGEGDGELTKGTLVVLTGLVSGAKMNGNEGRVEGTKTKEDGSTRYVVQLGRDGKGKVCSSTITL